MQNTIEIECPREILLGLHLDAGQFAELVKEEAAIALFREGRLTETAQSRSATTCRRPAPAAGAKQRQPFLGRSRVAAIGARSRFCLPFARIGPQADLLQHCG